MQRADNVGLIALGWLIIALSGGVRGAEQRFTTVTPKIGDPFELLEGFSAVEPVGPDGKPLPGWVGSGQMILLADGRLALAWVSGKKLNLSFSKDAGTTWDAPRRIERGLPESTNTARPNLVQTADGALCLTFYGWEKFDAKDPATCVNHCYVTRSSDGGETWSMPRRVLTGYVGMPQGSLCTSKGRLLVPWCIYTGVRVFSGLCMLSDDGGETWKQSSRVEVPDEKEAPTTRPLSPNLSRGAIEPTVAERADGTLLMIIRTIFGVMYECESADGGQTWSTPKRSSLDCGGPGNMVRLPSGRLAIAFNPANLQSPETQRWGSPIGYNTQSLAVLADDNKTWHITRDFTKQIQGKVRVVHSTITGLPDGTMLITLPGRSTLIRR